MDVTKQAKKLLELRKRYNPELHKTFSNVVHNAKEIIKSGVAKFCSSPLHYAQLSTLFLSFVVTYDNYMRGDICARTRAQSSDILSRMRTLYECRIEPFLEGIDEEFSRYDSTKQPDPKIIESLQNTLQETRDILSEILNVVIEVDMEMERQKKKNKLSMGGMVFGLGTAAFLATPVGAGLGLATAAASAYGYKFGTDNEKILKEAKENLERGRQEANNHERKLMQYITKLEMKDMFAK